MLSDRCLSVLSVTLVYCCQRLVDQDEMGMVVGLSSATLCQMWTQLPPKRAPGRAWFSSPACTWHCSLHYFFIQAIHLLQSPAIPLAIAKTVMFWSCYYGRPME